MYPASDLLILSFGFTMLKLISCYSDGFSLADQCQGMNIIHISDDGSEVPTLTTEAPFSVEPENVTLTDSEWGTASIDVVLSAKTSNFRGFMLDARKSEDGVSVGTFTLVDLDNSVLICDNRVVAQPNNNGKTSIRVVWTPNGAGQFFFRAAFVEDFTKFWRRKPIIVPSQSTTPQPAQTTLTSTTNPPITAPSTHPHATSMSTVPQTSQANKNQTTSTTNFTTTSNIDSKTTGMSTVPQTSQANKNRTTSTTNFTTTSNINSQTTAFLTDMSAVPPTSQANSTQMNKTTSTTLFTATSNIDSPATVVTLTRPSQSEQYVRSVSALLLFSRLCFLGGSSLLIIRPVSKKTVTMSASVLELASKTIAAILILIKAIKIVFTALTVAAMVSSLLHTITVFLPCGPSHELRKYWVCAIIIVDLMNTIITTTAIFFGIWCYEERWLPILMGVYVVWEIMLYLGTICFQQMGKYQTRVKRNQNNIQENRICPWLVVFLIFIVFNVMFTTALMAGVSLNRMIN